MKGELNDLWLIKNTLFICGFFIYKKQLVE